MGLAYVHLKDLTRQSEALMRVHGMVMKHMENKKRILGDAIDRFDIMIDSFETCFVYRERGEREAAAWVVEAERTSELLEGITRGI